jgi:hypothetical protein
MAALYISVTEAIHETFGKDIEPQVNRLLEGIKPHLPEDAAGLVDFMLGFSSSSHTLPLSSGGLFGELTIH